MFNTEFFATALIIIGSFILFVSIGVTSIQGIKKEKKRYFIINYSAFRSNGSIEVATYGGVGEGFPNLQYLQKHLLQYHTEAKSIYINNIIEVNKIDFDMWTKDL
jgi:hypothetical protein